jgi:hypothetical protein
MGSTSITDPTKAQLETVIRWLKKEHLEELHGESGFYCNRSMIRESFRDSEIKCIVKARSVIGFSTFRLGGNYSAIDILEIRSAHRRNGHGRLLATHMIQMLFQAGAPYIAIQCSPSSSEPFWRSLGFIDQEAKYGSWGNPKLVLRPGPNNSFKPKPLRGSA